MNTVASHQAKLTEKKKIAPDIYSMCYEIESDIDFKAGQFMTFKFDDGNRAYSIASSPTNKRCLEFIIRMIPNGLASGTFKKVSIGNKQKMIGPAGMFTLKDNDTPKIFLATGIGIAPFRSMIHYLSDTNFSHQFILFWGNRYEPDFILQNEWEKIREENAYFEYVFSISREDVQKEHFYHGHVQEALIAYIEQNKLKKDMFEYYVCGSGANVKNIIEFLKNELSISENSIYTEQFS